MREIALDTETTGLDPAQGHRVVEIGCVELWCGVRTGKHFHTYFCPERDMPEEAFRIHGLSNEFLADKPRFAERAAEFLTFIADAKLVIHNAAFDMKFVNAELGLCGFAPIEFSRAIDTVSMARRKFPGSPASLDALCKRFSIDLSSRTKHGALLDAELLADVYLELLGGRQHALIQTEAAAEDAGSFETHEVTACILARDFPASAEEKARHAEFLEKIKQPVWRKYSEEA